MRDPYEVLGLPEGAPDEDVRAAYRRLTRQWHPDRHVDASPEEQAAAAARFAEVSGAYRLLQDPAALARWRGAQRRRAAQTDAAPRSDPAPRPGTQRPDAARPEPRRHERPPGDLPDEKADPVRDRPFDYRTAAASEFHRRPAGAPRTPTYGYTARGGTPRTPPRTPPPTPSRPRRRARASRPPRPPWDGAKLLASAVLVVVVVPLLTIGLIQLAQSDDGRGARPAAVPRELGGARTVPTSALSIGDCFDASTSEGREEGEENTVWAVMPAPCSVAHESEVIGRLDVGDALGPAYPGREAIVAHAQPTCHDAYSAAVGAPAGPGMPLGLHFIFPSRGSWADGDRLVVCAVESHDGTPLVGTARQTARTAATS